MTWEIQRKIAGVVVQIDSDSSACQQDMAKFLMLYEQVSHETADFKLRVLKRDDYFQFIFIDQHGNHELLWQSSDDREVSAALEIHFYSKIIQYLDPDICSIHAAVLNINQQACMFAGLSGAGKSSICTAGLLAEAAYLSDEFTLLDRQGYAHPFPRPMQWEHPTHPAFDRKKIQATGLIAADYFDFPNTQGEITRCHLWHPKQVQRSPLPLQTIVLHQYQPQAAKAELIEIPRHEALLELPQHLHVQRGMAQDLPMLNQRIDNMCRFYRLPFSDVFKAWALVEKQITNISALR